MGSTWTIYIDRVCQQAAETWLGERGFKRGIKLFGPHETTLIKDGDCVYYDIECENAADDAYIQVLLNPPAPGWLLKYDR